MRRSLLTLCLVFVAVPAYAGIAPISQNRFVQARAESADGTEAVYEAVATSNETFQTEGLAYPDLDPSSPAATVTHRSWHPLYAASGLQVIHAMSEVAAVGNAGFGEAHAHYDFSFEITALSYVQVTLNVGNERIPFGPEDLAYIRLEHAEDGVVVSVESKLGSVHENAYYFGNLAAGTYRFIAEARTESRNQDINTSSFSLNLIGAPVPEPAGFALATSACFMGWICSRIRFRRNF